LPAFAKIQDHNEEMAEAYRSLVDYIARFVLPVSGCVAIAAPELLASLYGVKWLPAAMPMRILVVGLALAGLRIGIGTVFYAKSYPSFDIYLMSGRLALLSAIILLTFRQGLSLVSFGVSVVEGIISIIGQNMVCWLIGFRLRALISAMTPGVRLALPCMLATAAGKMLATWFGVNAPFVLVFVAVPPAAVFSWLQVGDAAEMIGNRFQKDAEQDRAGALIR